MKIKNKIGLIILSVIGVFTALIVTINFIFDLSQHKKHLNIAYKITNDFAEWENKYYAGILAPFIEHYFELKAEKMIKAINKLYVSSNRNSFALEGNKELRKLFVESAYMEGVQIGYVALIYDKKKILICSKAEDEGKGMECFLDRCAQDFREKIYSFNSEDPSSYRFSYTDKENHVRDAFASIACVPDTNLMLINAISIESCLQPIFSEITRDRQTAKNNIDMDFYVAFLEEKKYELLFSFLSFIVVYLLSIPIVMIVSKSVSLPISNLRNEVQKLGKGCFNVSVKELGVDEVRDLINSFNYLGKELSVYIETLKNEVKRRQRIETEINLAREIQESTLPKITSAFTETKFQLGAKLLPAETVGGDFYDFFFVNDKLVLCIADISGKGIYAAFFMAMTKILIKNLCYQYSNPSKVLYEANRTLIEGNNMSMFATVFLCFIDINTRILTFSNAGHEDVLLISNDNSVRLIGRHERPPVGLAPDSQYITETISIEPTDMLVFYTDGITEALSPNSVAFKLDNLKKLLLDNKTLSSQDLCNLAVDRVNNFENNKLFDDMTIMIFKSLN